MASWEINVQIDEKFQGHLEERQLQHLVEKTLGFEGISSPVELGLVIADEKLVQELNRGYRGRDEPTDVLAFSLSSPQIEEAQFPFASPPNGVLHLGEVIISYPQALRQAKEHQHSIEAEIALLIVHGVLHLLGYDHEEPEQDRLMKAREKEILNQI
jgi:probable rRNA maturation factor